MITVGSIKMNQVKQKIKDMRNISKFQMPLGRGNANNPGFVHMVYDIYEKAYEKGIDLSELVIYFECNRLGRDYLAFKTRDNSFYLVVSAYSVKKGKPTYKSEIKVEKIDRNSKDEIIELLVEPLSVFLNTNPDHNPLENSEEDQIIHYADFKKRRIYINRMSVPTKDDKCLKMHKKK